MKIDHFIEWENEIEKFCHYNHLDFEKIKGLSRCNGYDFLILYCNEQNIQETGLLDDRSLPSVMLIKKANGDLVIETTEFADLYLKSDDHHSNL